MNKRKKRTQGSQDGAATTAAEQERGWLNGRLLVSFFLPLLATSSPTTSWSLLAELHFFYIFYAKPEMKRGQLLGWIAAIESSE